MTLLRGAKDLHLSLLADGNCCQVGEVQLEPAAERTQLTSECRDQKGRAAQFQFVNQVNSFRRQNVQKKIHEGGTGSLQGHPRLVEMYTLATTDVPEHPPRIAPHPCCDWNKITPEQSQTLGKPGKSVF